MVVVLVGFMGAGKTTVGHIMAERLGQPFVDSDVLIEQRLGRDIRDIFRTEGEPYFRQLEHDTVAGLVRGPDAVIALGGGAVEDPRSRAVLRNARVVYLRVSYDEALARVKSDEFRPMLHRPDLDEVYKRRLSAYEDISVLTVDTDGRRPDAVALEVLAPDPAARDAAGEPRRRLAGPAGHRRLPARARPPGPADRPGRSPPRPDAQLRRRQAGGQPPGPAHPHVPAGARARRFHRS
jgi:Shikimate kinase